MATIKTTGSGAALRIVTKTVGGQARVSCGCCEEAEAGCCMYPAQGLIDGLFTVADLPDEIAMSSDGGYVLDKIDPPVPAFGVDGITMYYGLSGEGVGIEDATGGWVFFQDGGINEDVIATPACLFSDANVPQTPPFDVFEDTYTVTGLPNFWPQQSVQIVRQSLCQWEGDAGGQETRVVLTYWDGSDRLVPSGANKIGWWLTVGEQSSDSIGREENQSSPSGSYGAYEVT